MQEHEYQGIRFPGEISKETLDVIPDYPVRDDDIFIVTYPKAGTNWMIEIVSKVMKAAGKMATPEEHSMWCFELHMPGDEKPRHELMKDAPSPRIIHTHLQRHLAPKTVANPTGKIKVIVVMRNPKDTAVSLYHYNKKMVETYGGCDAIKKRLESWEGYAEVFLKGKGIFGDFYDHVLGWWQMKDDRHFFFIKYEDMKKDLRSVVSEVASFLETSLDDAAVTNIAESCTFDSLKASWGKSELAMKKLICRKDTAVSFYHYEKKMFKEYSRPGDVVPKRYESWEAYADNFLKGKVIFGDFYNHVLGWWQMKDDHHFLFLKYEDMKKDLRSVVSEVASFLETSLDAAAVTNIADSCTFNNLKAVWSNSGSVMKENICRKGVIGDWKSMFTPEKNEAYDDKHKLRLAGTGLEFDFE
ncbi:PREDICTED: sulfotransferase 1C4-like [Branchiostoma belcheri]|uniref:Sulfotransferase n=1 Tax=Branchiostoma belcheri TaxID=7741 RepID=A0A6P4YS27_BRABE|nr:PREDICTED: sulfotransferase 1C4-like [Branchiostoma belcheri]